MRSSFKNYLLGFALFFVALTGVTFFAMRPKPVPPLPFDPTVFVSTQNQDGKPLMMLPANAVVARAGIFYFAIMEKFRGKSAYTWFFPASPKTGCSIQGLLNQCEGVSGTRYLMPLSVATGMVQFGNTNTLNGPQWVAAFEKELQTGDVQFWDQQTKRMRHENLALLRFPAQKTIVVLPMSEAAEFERTNGIHLPEGGGK